MGYETTLLIGKDTDITFDDYTYFTVYATIDLGKISRSNILLLPWENHTPQSKQWEFLTAGDNNQEPKHEDNYGVKLQPIPINDVINALKKDIIRDNHRPAIHAVSLLETIADTVITDEKWHVMFYGH